MPRFEKWLTSVRNEGFDELIYILAGVMPVKSVKALLYMKEDVPGMSIADEYIKRMESAADPKEEGVAICVETIKRLKDMPGVKGVHVMPVLWEAIMPRIVQEAGLLPRPTPPPMPQVEPEAIGAESK
jgi:methylenetetrahydrofolate reductase (NADPH)